MATKMVSIANLDDYTLVRILNRIPLAELIPYRLVCPKWLSIIEMEIASKRISLQLFRSSASRDNYRGLLPEDSIEHVWFRSYDCLVTAKLNRSECGRFLVRLFPQVQELFVQFHPAFCDGFLLLLNQWKTSLVTFTLYFPNSLDEYGNLFSLRMLWRCLQSFSFEPTNTLRKLAITSATNQVALPSNLGHIEAVQSLALFRFADEQIESLLHNQIGPNVTELTVEEANLTASMLKYLLKTKPQLKTNLSSLSIKCYDWDGSELGNGDEVLSLLVSNCKALTCLDITFKEKLHIEDIASELRQLPNLTSLTLRSFNKYIFSDIESCEDNQDLVMPSVTELTLHLRIKLDKLKLLSVFFPSIRKLTVDFSWITCRCVSRQMERNMAGSALICAQCYEDIYEHWSSVLAAGLNVTSRKLRFTNFANLE